MRWRLFWGSIRGQDGRWDVDGMPMVVVLRGDGRGLKWLSWKRQLQSLYPPGSPSGEGPAWVVMEVQLCVRVCEMGSRAR